MFKICFCTAIISLFCLTGVAQKFEKFPAKDYYGHFVYTPPAYDENPNQPFPLLIAYHGVGEGGSGSSADLEKLKNTGIPKLISQNRWPNDRPFIVLCPQSSKGFMNPNTLRKTLNRVLRDYHVDEERIYVTGYSAGAMAIWIDFKDVYKDLVAAAVPIAGNEVRSYDICEIKDVPIWAFHGGADPNGPTPPGATVNNIQNINSCTPPPAQKARLTIFPGVGHNSWDMTYDLSGMSRNTEYDDYDVDIYTWMLQHSKKKEGLNINSFQASPSSFFNNTAQTIRFTARVSSGNAIESVSLNLSTIGGSSNHQMVYSGGQYVLNFQASAGLSVGNKYISVTARDNAGNEATRSLMLLVEEDNSVEPPANLETTPVNTGEIRLNWIDRSDNETGFVVEYRRSNESSYKVLGSVNENITTYSATGLDCGATFFFRIKAVNDNNSSSYTNEASASPLDLTAPEVAIDGDLNFCEGGGVELSSEADYAEYLWSNGANTKSITASVSGAYSLKVKDQNNCWSANSESIEVKVDPLPAKPEIAMNGNGTICPGSSVALEAPAGHDEYLWSNGATTQTIQVDVPGEFTVSVADNGCWSPESESATVSDETDPVKPAVNYDGTNEFCEGESTTLATPAGYNYYLWSDGRTTRTIEVDQTGSYSVQVAHCPDEWSEDADPVSLTFHSLPAKPGLTASGDTEFCEGGSVALTAPETYAQYEWRNHTSTTHEAQITSSGTFSVRGRSEEGCWSPYSNPVQVTVNAVPEQPEVIYDGNPVVCPGQGFTLSAPEGHQEYLWSNGATSRIIEATEPGEYAVAVANNGCWSEESESTEVAEKSDPPKPVVNFTGDSEFCAGESAILNAPTRFNHYLWSDGTRTRRLEADRTGSYSVQVANCPDEWSEPSNAVSLTFHDLPARPVLTASGDTEICEGEKVTLNATGGFSEYDWQNHPSITAAATITKSGSYAVRVMNEGGCWSGYSEAVSVTVHANPAAPKIEYDGEPVICPGKGFELTASGSYEAYLWSNGATSKTIETTEPGEFTVAVSNNGCWSASSEPAIVSDKSETPRPELNYNGRTEFCAGENVVITAPAGYNHYVWSDGSAQRTIQVEQTGAYSVQVANCPGAWSEASEAVAIEINPRPETPVVDAEGSDYCAGEKASLSVSGNYEGYFWSNGENVAAIQVEQEGNYAVRVKNQFNCWSDYSESVKISFREMATPELVPYGDADLCEGETLTLKAKNVYNKYLWSNGATEPSITIDEPGTYFVQVSNCHSDVWSDPSEAVEVQVHTIPDPVITENEGAFSIEGYDAYQWTYNGSPILGATASYYAPTETGNYAVEVFNEFGCSKVAEEIEFVYENQDIVVYPNPSSGRFAVKLINSKLKEGSIIINSLENKNVAFVQNFSRNFDGMIEFDLSHFDSGFYILIIETEYKTVQSKLVIH